MRTSAFAAVLLCALVTGPSALAFWGKKTDEEKLAKKTGSLKVQLYLTAKGAVVKSAGSPEMKAVADRFVDTASATVVSVKDAQVKLAAAKSDGGAAAAEVAVAKDGGPPGLSGKELAALGASLWELRHVGKAVMEGDEGTTPPLLPVLLAPVPLPEGFRERLDANTDHALLFTVFSLVTLHPALPTPLPQELVLYEAANTDPSAVKIDGMAAPLHGLKAYSFAMNDLCEFAGKESAKVVAAGATPPAKLAAGLLQVSGKAVAVSEKAAGRVDAAALSLAQGSTAVCHYQNAQFEKGGEALLGFLDTAEKNGFASFETHLLRAYAECSTRRVEAGKARIDGLAKRTELSKTQREDLSDLRDSCGEDASASKKLVGTARLGRLVATAAYTHLDESGLFTALGETAWVKSVKGFGEKLSGTFSAGAGGLAGKLSWGKDE